MQWGDGGVPRHVGMPVAFHMWAELSKKFFVGVLPYHFGCLMLRQKKTGTKACTFQKAPYAYPVSGIVITIGAYSVKTPMNSGQRDTWTRTESLCLDLSKRTGQGT